LPREFGINGSLHLCGEKANPIKSNYEAIAKEIVDYCFQVHKVLESAYQKYLIYDNLYKSEQVT
jgi:hypothetical protein